MFPYVLEILLARLLQIVLRICSIFLAIQPVIKSGQCIHNILMNKDTGRQRIIRAVC